MVEITEHQAATFERCMSVGGIGLIPTDTVYGLACDASSEEAVERLYELKKRELDKPSAVMFFQLELAFASLPSLGPRLHVAIERLLPGALTLLLPNPDNRFPLACGSDPDTLGLRVPNFSNNLSALRNIEWPVIQSSANLAGEKDAACLEDVPAVIRAEVDLVLDGGELPGRSSTIVDLRHFENEGEWIILREGVVTAQWIADALA